MKIATLIFPLHLNGGQWNKGLTSLLLVLMMKAIPLVPLDSPPRISSFKTLLESETPDSPPAKAAPAPEEKCLSDGPWEGSYG